MQTVKQILMKKIRLVVMISYRLNDDFCFSVRTWFVTI